MSTSINSGQIATVLLQAISRYDETRKAYQSAEHDLWNLLHMWACRQEKTAQAYTWLRSQPLQLLGITIPEEVLAQLPVLEPQTPSIHTPSSLDLDEEEDFFPGNPGEYGDST